MWTTVRRYLQGGDDDKTAAPEPRVSCPVCMVDVAIRGVPGQQPCPYKLSRGEQVVGAVLPCAHVICQGCIAAHVRTSAHKKCPCCRADMRYPGCGHLVPAKRVPVATSEDETMVPPTVPELVAAGGGGGGGGVVGEKFPEHCFGCKERCTREYAEIGFDYMADVIYDTSTGSAGVVDPAWRGIVDAAITSVLDHMMVGISSGPSWKPTGVSDNLPLQVAFIGDSRLGDRAKKSEYDGQDVIEYVQEGGVGAALWSVPLWRGQ